MKKNYLVALLLAFVFTQTALADSDCPNDTINPVSDINWNNMFPITIGGAQVSPSGTTPKPLLMNMPTVCSCDRGLLVFGIGLTYFAPELLAEVQNKPGCYNSLGGTEMDTPPVMGVTATESQGMDNGNDVQGQDSRQMNVHLYKYPLFGMMDIWSTLACTSTQGFSVLGTSEVDPFWQDAVWSNTINPESFLYANPVAAFACIPDAISSTFNMPIDALNWCVGAQGMLYPVTGAATNSSSASPAEGNLLILAKYMQQMARSYMLQVTIGPGAYCSSMPYPNLLRSQYRLDPVKPVHSNSTAVFGKWGMTWTSMPPLNPESRYDNTFVIWQGEQCCAF